MKKTTYEREYEKEIKKVKKEYLTEQFCYGFLWDYGAYCMEHPIKAVAPAVGIGVVGGIAAKVAFGTIPWPARFAIHLIGNLAVPTAMGLKRVAKAKKDLEITIERA